MTKPTRNYTAKQYQQFGDDIAELDATFARTTPPNGWWGNTTYTPDVTPGYTTPGTMGIGFRGPQHFPRTEKKKWTRICTQCGKAEVTTKTAPNPQPQF